MRNRRDTVWGLFAAAVLIVLVLTGCRAFEPEAVIVNKTPETYIIGAPSERGGGYYHFHVYWYGSDEDGSVERFVWALTDTTIQDEDVPGDEEDQRFNPALDASTLEIAQWTTRTDSIFDFRIEQGVRQSADMTLHMVAMDDFGDFDRTPARLHFFSNTLGNPIIRFFRVEGDQEIPLALGATDTVGFARRYTIGWSGESPNIRGYSAEALALVDTVFPYDDGLFGFKWRLLGDVAAPCNPSLEDCWNPRLFNEAAGDSFSYFADLTSLTFENGTGLPHPSNPFLRLLPSGGVTLRVNSIDVAGVEVAEFRRELKFVVNYDPETIILNNETDWEHPSDPEIYPYYILLNDPAQVHHPFTAGDTIPDRTYVVVKALGRDDPRDETYRAGFQLALPGFVEGFRRSLTGGVFEFKTGSSVHDSIPTWGPVAEDGWYADTLGFMVAPRSDYVFNMAAIDEHLRRDGTAAQLGFSAGREPCVQCIELLPNRSEPSAFTPSLACFDSTVSGHACMDGSRVEYAVSSATLAPPGQLTRTGTKWLAIDRSTLSGARVVDSQAEVRADEYGIEATRFTLIALLHGQDDPEEAWSEIQWRTLAWRYQVDYECDPLNTIQDGDGSDSIDRITWSATETQEDGDGLYVTPDGLWRVSIQIYVPSDMLSLPPAFFYNWVLMGATLADGDAEIADKLWNILIRQLGDGEIQAVALDQTHLDSYSGLAPRPYLYNYFRGVRPSVATPPPDKNWRSADLFVSGVTDRAGSLDLSAFAMESQGGVPVKKLFRITAIAGGGDVVDCNTPPPSTK
ncbi:MAG: hypothetical protein GY838_05775 [bacterium]|nr:hypothetical protein [bacterium]